ncbi:nucleotidyltransferase family protein [Candidatus Electronema sp. TJ]|uniref:nucleotidyltransferase family protein n=1 Tax=Candidatus Electronema sp. TJ TaxID=3401573 RepID=UPI003AA9D724
MLLAAGLGTRLRPYTLVRPKPLFPICNRPLLHILFDKLAVAGCGTTVVNCHHLAGQIVAAAAERPEVIVQREEEVLGTGGGLRKAMENFADGPVLVMNGDIYHDISLSGLLLAHAAGGRAVTLALHDCPRFNTVRVRGERVCGFGPTQAGETLLAFTGLHVVEREVLARIPAQGFFHIIDLYEYLAQARQVGCVRVDGCFWQDIGTLADYLDLHRRLLAERIPAWEISTQTEVGEGAIFNSWGAVGAGAVIGAGAQLTRCIVWENAAVPSGVELADQIVMPCC